MKPTPKFIKLFRPPGITDYALHFMDIEVTYSDGSKETNVIATYSEILQLRKRTHPGTTINDIKALVCSNDFTEADQIQLLNHIL